MRTWDLTLTWDAILMTAKGITKSNPFFFRNCATAVPSARGLALRSAEPGSRSFVKKITFHFPIDKLPIVWYNIIVIKRNKKTKKEKKIK